MERENKPARIEGWNNARELVLMSIGTDKGSWWADPDFGSELRLLRQAGRVDGRTAGTFRQKRNQLPPDNIRRGRGGFTN
jgi:hypothetical protein